MQQVTYAGAARRWLVLAAVVVFTALTTGQPMPLYDGIGFPDEPYRFLPARAGSGAAGPATVATVDLKVAGGVNTTGIVANSAESGPQVSVFLPPRALAASGTAPIVVRATPVLPTPPMPSGSLDSNIYALSFTSPGGPVTPVSGAQPLTITLRAVSIKQPLPVFVYRSAPAQPWRQLRTKLAGRDIFNAQAPGAGEYALVQIRGSAPSGARSKGPLYAVLVATLLLIAGVLVAVRVLSRRSQTRP